MNPLPFVPPLAVVLLSLASLRAQFEIATVHAGSPWSGMGREVAGIGDGNGDGAGDFLVTSYQGGLRRVQLISGLDGTELGQVQSAGAVLGGALDMDLDGHPDCLLANASGALQARRGSDLGLLWTSSAVNVFDAACGVADIDGDGRDDVAAILHSGGSYYVVTLRGSDGSQLQSAGPLPQDGKQIVNLGDALGTGDDVVAVRCDAQVLVYRTSPLAFYRTLVTPLTSYVEIGAADAVNDARKEVAVCRNGHLYVCSPISGQTLRDHALPGDAGFAVVGDLDADGHDDFAVLDSLARYGSTADSRVAFLAGGSGAFLSHWSRTWRFYPRVLTGVGDVDGDGVSDLLLGDEYASATGSGVGGGAWQLVSGRIRGRTWHIAVQCNGGPFPPDLGMTRPILGQPVTFVGRDCPPTAPGTLALSLQPDDPINLGYPGCDAWFDVGRWSILHQPAAAATWTYTLPLPNAAELAGINVAVQAFYVPTNSPIGYDLSNAIWARLGF